MFTVKSDYRQHFSTRVLYLDCLGLFTEFVLLAPTGVVPGWCGVVCHQAVPGAGGPDDRERAEGSDPTGGSGVTDELGATGCCCRGHARRGELSVPFGEKDSFEGFAFHWRRSHGTAEDTQEADK